MSNLILLKMQIARIEGDERVFERWCKHVVDRAMKLEDKPGIPAVKKQMSYLAALQESAFWNEVELDGLEDLRRRLRGLMIFLDA